MVEDAQDIGGPKEEDQQKERPQVMQLDVDELCPPGGAVHLGGLHGFPGHRLESRKQHQIDERGPLPDVDGGHRAHRQDRNSQPLDLRVRDAGGLQQVIEHPVAGRIDEASHDADGNGRHHQGQHGQHVQGGAEPGPADGAMDQQRERQTEQDLGGKDDQGIDPGRA